MKKIQSKKIIFPPLIALALTLSLLHLIIPDNMHNNFKAPPPSLSAHNRSKTFSILSANVGNLSLGCRNVLNKLCYKDVEERIANNIKLLSPDIIALQEVLAPWQCKNLKEKNKKKVCSQFQDTPQVRRLVGDNYTITCNTRNQFECIAVKKSFGEIIGCPDGELCNNARTAPEVNECDNGFTISAATIKMHSTSMLFDVVNFHPQSTSSTCRAKMIRTALDGDENSKSIIQEKNVILLGDFNFDPWRDNDESVIAWKTFVENGWNGSKLEYHSGIAENNPPYFTSFLFFKPRTVDFILSNFTSGICHILGESPNTFRLDGGKGTDHRAIYGSLTIQP